MINKKKAIVTGCEGQLGKEFVKLLQKLNYHVIGIDLKKKTNNKGIEYCRVDISREKQVKNFFFKIKNYKNVDLLVNNAAFQIFSDFENRKFDEINQSVNVNLVSVILLTKLCFNFFFKKQKNGNIINIGSIYGVISPNFNIYSKKDRKSSEIYGATKAAVIHLTKYFANYFSKFNIQVNCISPGGIYNDKKQNKSFQKRYSNNVPMKRLAYEHEILETFKFLINKKNKYLNGQNIIIDGGLTLY